MKILAEEVLNQKDVCVLTKDNKVIKISQVNDSVGIQPIVINLVYGALDKFASWNDAEKALPPDCLVYHEICKTKDGSLRLNKIVSRTIKKIPKNPYRRAQKETIQVPTDQLQQKPILEQQDLYEGIPAPNRNKLENDYTVSNLSYGDRMRMISPQGDLVDVILMPDGMIGVQQITTKIDYGTMQKYPSWDDADAALRGWDFYKAVVAKYNDVIKAALEGLLQDTPAFNPYNR